MDGPPDARFRPINGIKINDETWVKSLKDSTAFRGHIN